MPTPDEKREARRVLRAMLAKLAEASKMPGPGRLSPEEFEARRKALLDKIREDA